MTADDDILDALEVENRRLRREVREHEARIRALEQSRWHRLNPRTLARRIVDRGDRQQTSEAGPTRRQDASAPPSKVGDPVSFARFEEDVAKRGAFTRDTVADRVGGWEPVLAGFDGRAVRILEIGSYEGLSTCYFLWRLEDAVLTCVDLFQERPDLAASFDSNVALVDATRVEKRVGDSRRVLLDLLAEGSRFDLVYVDGSHRGLDVLVDAALSWQVLRAGGVLVFDDYAWDEGGRDPLLRPGPAIDAFLSLIEGKYVMVSRAHQVIVAKAERDG